MRLQPCNVFRVPFWPCNPWLQYMWEAQPVALLSCCHLLMNRRLLLVLASLMAAELLIGFSGPHIFIQASRPRQTGTTTDRSDAHASADSKYTCERFWSTNSYHPIHTFLEKMLELFPELYQETLRLFAAMACGEMAAGDTTVQSTIFG